MTNESLESKIEKILLNYNSRNHYYPTIQAVADILVTFTQHEKARDERLKESILKYELMTNGGYTGMFEDNIDAIFSNQGKGEK